VANFSWISDHWLEIFGALAGVLYVLLEIRQSIWLWPVGIVTSAVYIVVFFSSKFYADMSLQIYYVIISFYGFYVWTVGSGTINGNQPVVPAEPAPVILEVSRTPRVSLIPLVLIYIALHGVMWYILSTFTDSPVAGWDSFTTALSVIAMWMLARKYIEHWILWVIVNLVSMILYIYKGLYPTTILFLIYTVMAVVGYKKWSTTLRAD